MEEGQSQESQSPQEEPWLVLRERGLAVLPTQATWVMSLSDSVAQQAKKPIHITSSLLVLLMALRLPTSPSGAAKVALPGTK